MILVWQIACDLPNLPNFNPTKLSSFTVANLLWQKRWLSDKANHSCVNYLLTVVAT